MSKSPSTARATVANYLTEQILGPSEYTLNRGVVLPEPGADGKVRISKADSENAFYDPVTGDPVLINARPKMVFGTGVLHAPFEQETPADDDGSEDQSFDEAKAQVPVPEVPNAGYKLVDDANEEPSSIDQSQKIRPSAMGFTAQLVVTQETELHFKVSGATYRSQDVVIEDVRSSTWFIREPQEEWVVVPWSELANKPNYLRKFAINGAIGSIAELQVRWRNTTAKDESGNNLVALTAVVAHKGEVDKELFQFQLSLRIEKEGHFSAADKTNSFARHDFEEQEVEFLYRHVSSYAYGHGISVEWDEVDQEKLVEVRTVSVPEYFQELVDTKVDGLSLRMMDLATWNYNESKSALQELIDGYLAWISDNDSNLSRIPSHQQEIGKRLVQKNRKIADRMQKGLEILLDQTQPDVFRAFQIANEAMHLQQQRGKIQKREFFEDSEGRLAYPERVWPKTDEYGTWRPFQIAFLLLVLPGLVNPLDEFREEVDLIFFPTGGGKTEAYLGAAAMLIAFRRLQDSKHNGVDVLMRYTLRLLTVQQFERSSGLIVALEHMRRQNPAELGENPISIGVWLGSKTTPNKRSKAVEALKNTGNKNDEAHPFVLNQCPWCGAQFGLRKIKNGSKHKEVWVGYQKSTEGPETLKFVCGDKSCDFSRESNALPIWITDEDVYDVKPAFVLGTVDKFAELAWQRDSRALFNKGVDGESLGLPPGLIIQDELHLISGPLGSLVGLYETIVDELCSYEIAGQKVRAKIIASTATTRKYETQIKNLYARESVTLFPQAITRANETFFSRISRENGLPMKGTQYLGINPATYATGQLASSQVSAFLSQAPDAWEGPVEEMDFYATSMWFFNSLKELGQTLTLMQSTVISLLSAMWRDRRLPKHKTRYLDRILELTGRVSSAEVREALDALKKTSGMKGFVRTCLASSIMEVGVDVPRLGLLTINSQPKLTAQYIQVSGRVGRNPAKGPGLVVMLYNSSRARDRSVYEQFGNYHKRLYAQVEPLSVTPFAIQTMEKGLMGAFVALYRLLGPSNSTPQQIDESRFNKVADVFRERIAKLDSSSARVEDFENRIRKLKADWERYSPIQWQYDPGQENGKSDNQSTALLRRRPERLDHIAGDLSETIPQSMRSVDGQTDIQPASNVYSFLPSESGS